LKKNRRGSLKFEIRKIFKIIKGEPLMQNAEANISKEYEKNKHIREVLENGDYEVKLSLIRQVGEITKLLIQSVFQDEINEKIGARYRHGKKGRSIYRWGSNPGSVRICEEKIKLNIPRLRDEQSKKEIPLDSYNDIKDTEPDAERLLKGVIHGISMNDYHDVVRQFEDSYGLGRSKVSEIFKEQSAKRVEEFFNRDLSQHNFIALFIDGKYLAKEQIVIVLGVTEGGDKIPLSFIQTHSENHRSIKELLLDLINRGLKYEEGLLCAIDGSTGMRKAIEETFGDYAVIKRCSWHKRENMLSYLPEHRKEEFKKKYDSAYGKTDYMEAQNAFIDLANDLQKINVSASRSIHDGLEELLTLHRLNLVEDFGRSFSTTNAIENLNSQLVKYVGRVKFWKTGDQRTRWVATALIEIEPRLKKINNHRNLNIFKEKIKAEVQKRIMNKNLEAS
jgi:transposase-like protein